VKYGSRLIYSGGQFGRFDDGVRVIRDQVVLVLDGLADRLLKPGETIVGIILFRAFIHDDGAQLIVEIHGIAISIYWRYAAGCDEDRRGIHDGRDFPAFLNRLENNLPIIRDRLDYSHECVCEL
jgi:hypothetical protein